MRGGCGWRAVGNLGEARLIVGMGGVVAVTLVLLALQL